MAAKKPVLKSTSKPAPNMPKGKGATRVNTRFIALSGVAKAGKTYAASSLIGAKWVISDQNAIPTLVANDRLPPDEDLYEVNNLAEAVEVTDQLCDAAEANGNSLGIPAVVYDSGSAFVDFHQQDVASQSGQRWLGDNKKDNGWQQFNNDFGRFLEKLACLARYTNVVLICHSKEKADPSKGDMHGLNFPPQMALKAQRLVNWLLFQTVRSYADDGSKPSPFEVIRETPNGKVRIERIIHTVPVGVWPASVSAKHLEPQEPPDLYAMLVKEGLL